MGAAQISTSATLRDASGKSYQKLQQTAQALNPLLETAGQRATQAGATIKESLLNPLGSYLGKAGKQLSEAYAANV